MAAVGQCYTWMSYGNPARLLSKIDPQQRKHYQQSTAARLRTLSARLSNKQRLHCFNTIVHHCWPSLTAAAAGLFSQCTAVSRSAGPALVGIAPSVLTSCLGMICRDQSAFSRGCDFNHRHTIQTANGVDRKSSAVYNRVDFTSIRCVSEEIKVR